MNSSSDAAESIIRISLQGMEVATRITGTGAKHLAVLMYTILKDSKQTRGKTNLINMIKSGKEVKLFGIKKEDLKQFTKEAKRYGVLFTAIVDKNDKSKNGMVDLMVRAEDASKINRIVERFKLKSEGINIKNVIEKNEIDKMIKEAVEKGVEVKSVEERLVDDILKKPIKKEANDISNPQLAKTEKSPLSKPLLKSKNKCEEGIRVSKPSVKETLSQIKNEQEKEAKFKNKENTKNKLNQSNHNQHHKGKKRKIKERG